MLRLPAAVMCGKPCTARIPLVRRPPFRSCLFHRARLPRTLACLPGSRAAVIQQLRRATARCGELAWIKPDFQLVPRCAATIRRLALAAVQPFEQRDVHAVVAPESHRVGRAGRPRRWRHAPALASRPARVCLRQASRQGPDGRGGAGGHDGQSSGTSGFLVVACAGADALRLLQSHACGRTAPSLPLLSRQGVGALRRDPVVTCLHDLTRGHLE
jgi:hypothetical protein